MQLSVGNQYLRKKLVAWMKPAVFASNVCHVLALVASIYALSASNAHWVDFSPINGTFQNFNPIARLQHGQAMFADFACYLGIGPTTMMRLVAGPSALYSDTVFAASLCASACAFFMFVSLGIFARIPTWIAVFVGLMVIGSHWGFISISSRLPWVKFVVWNLCEGANSALPLRAVFPFLFAALCGLFRGQEIRLGRLSARQALVMGAGLACGFVWSNDYGAASFASFFATQLLFWQPAVGQWRKNLRLAAKNCGLVLSSFVVALGVLLYAATHGHPHAWFDYNFRSVAADQYWYFSGETVLFWRDITLGRHCIFGVAVLLTFCAYIRLVAAKRAAVATRDVLLVYVTLACFLAGMISQVGGHIDERYFTPFAPCFVFVLLSLIRHVAQHFNVLRWGKAKLRGSAISDVVLPLSTGILFTLALGGTTRAYIRHAFDKPQDVNGVRADQLGGSFRLPAMDSMVAWGRRIEKETEHRPPSSRLFSTYSTALDILAGARNPTRADYVIHALGQQERKQYLQDFHRADAPYATTLRPDTVPWETWIRRANWFFYRELLHSYEPIDTTLYHIIWHKKPGGVVDTQFDVDCDVQQVDGSTVVISTRTHHHGQPPEHARYADIEISYRVDWAAPGSLSILEGPGRRLVHAHSFVQEEPGGDVPVVGGGIVGLRPETTTSWLPLEAGPAGRQRFTLQASPAGRVNLSGVSCKAVDLCRKDAIDDFKPKFLSPAAMPREGFRNGISVQGNQTQVLLSDNTTMQHLAIGDTLQFTSGLATRVKGLSGDVVTVDGVLDVKADGFPHIAQILPAQDEPPGAVMRKASPR